MVRRTSVAGLFWLSLSLPGCLDLGDAEPEPSGNGGSGGSAVDGSWPTGGGGSSQTPPDLLPDGRTYDQQLQYIRWSGNVSLVTIEHKDGTSLPTEEGGAGCDNGCSEQVTRIEAGGSIWGRFSKVTSLDLQLAKITDANAGSAMITACGQTIGTVKLDIPGSGTPGFSNYPQPSWVPPGLGECEWRVSAQGGYALFRAITVQVAP